MDRKRRKSRKPFLPTPESRAQSAILVLADSIGIGSAYRQIPESAKAKMYGKPCLPPVVTLDRTLREDADVLAAANGIREGLKRVNLSLGWLNDATVPLASMYSALAHLDVFLRGFVKQNPSHPGALQCHRVVEEVVRHGVPAAGSALENVVISNLLPLQRFDSRVYGVRIRRPAPGAHELRLELQLFTEPARRVQVEVDGIARPAFQCGGFLRPDIIDWIKWRPSEMGLQGTDEPCPVLVQSHAINNLYERMGVPRDLNAPMVLMFHALLKPNVIVRQPDGSVLVECTTGAGRVGYFVVRLVKDKFLVSTFLFLTMKGTPEAERLYERLRVGRHTVETLGLDRLETFILSDVAHDKELAAVLKDCGCGHLLQCTDQMPFKHRLLMREARRMRRILGWATPASEKEEEWTMEQVEDTLDEIRGFVEKAEQGGGVMARLARRIAGLLPRGLGE